MKTVSKWLPIGIGLFFLVFLLSLPFFAGPGSMMGGGWSGWGMMGGGYPMMGFGFWMMAAVFLVPILLIALVVGAVIEIQRNSQGNSESPTALLKCSHCGKTVQKDWLACPHCGKKL